PTLLHPLSLHDALPIYKLDLAAVVLQQGSQPPANAEIDPRAAIDGVEVPEIVPFLIGHHFERQLVMVAQEDCPLAVVGNVRRLADRKSTRLNSSHVKIS